VSAYIDCSHIHFANSANDLFQKHHTSFSVLSRRSLNSGRCLLASVLPTTSTQPVCPKRYQLEFETHLCYLRIREVVGEVRVRLNLARVPQRVTKLGPNCIQQYSSLVVFWWRSVPNGVATARCHHTGISHSRWLVVLRPRKLDTPPQNFHRRDTLLPPVCILVSPPIVQTFCS
jgi:hypothetical protein